MRVVFANHLRKVKVRALLQLRVLGFDFMKAGLPCLSTLVVLVDGQAQ